MEFQGHYSMTVNGAINAIGAPNDTILFTVKDHSTFDVVLNNPGGSWNGIRFRNSPDTSWFSFCKFQYSKAVGASWPDNAGGVMSTSYGHSGPLIIRNSHFYHNYCSYKGGAIIYEGTPYALIKNCRFNDNQADTEGGVLYCWDVKLNCDSSNFANNRTNGHAGAIGFGNGTHLKLTNSIFKNHSAQKGGAISGYGSVLNFTNNIFANNQSTSEGGAIRLYENPFPVLKGNIIVNNESGTNGGGLYMYLSDAILINNTICNNVAGTGGAAYLYNSIPEIHNSIIYGNQPDQLNIATGISSPDIFYTNLEGDSTAITGHNYTGQYKNNLDVQPDFVSPSAGAGVIHDGFAADWALADTSLCINRGAADSDDLNLPEKDVYNNHRIGNKIVDMGAVETYLGTTIVSDDIYEDTYWIADTVKINADIAVFDGATLRINQGTVVQFQGEYKLLILGRLLAEGTIHDTILFTIIPGLRDQGWESIIFNNNTGDMSDNDTSRLDYCRFEYGRSGHQGSISTYYYSMLVVSNSSFYESSHDFGGGGTINISNADPVVRDNTFTKCSGVRVIAIEYGSPLITGNKIVDNDAYGIGGWMSNPIIRGNFISSNDYGIHARASNTRDWIISNNIVVNNNIGIHAQDEVGAILQNNTIVNNSSEMYTYTANLVMVNNIVRADRVFFRDESNISIIHCNLTGGKDLISILSNSVVEFEKIIESDPVYKNPTLLRGIGYLSNPADWQVLSISPCINAGTTEKNATAVDEFDIFGNPRVSHQGIDIGAVENQMWDPDFTKHPLGAVICSGDSLLLWVRANDTVSYQWQKDGVNITGANDPKLFLDSIVLGDQGGYQCIITNSFGTRTSYPANLIVNVRPNFILEPEGGWATNGQPVILKTFARGSNLNYSWFRDDTLLAGQISPDLVIPRPGLEHEGSYKCVITNSCGSDTSTSPNLYLAPQICMVTVSATTGNNLVVWEKKSKAPVIAYNVYRESIAAGIYDKLVTMSYDELSVFVDTTADPTVQAYLYKITAIDTANNETDIDLCDPHKTIHLIVSTNPELNTTQLQWDRYFGFDYQTYTIYKSTTGLNFDPVHSLSASLNSWTDPEASTGDLFYRIAVEKPDPCVPEGSSKKAGTGPYQHALSNMDDNKLKDDEPAAETFPPDTISLTNNSIAEESLPGTMIGKLLTQDPDSADSFTYQFISGEGDDDNLSFTLLGDLLLSSESFDYETKNQYRVRIRSTDKDGGYCEVSFIILVNDVDETTGLQVQRGEAVKVFPNPFSQMTTIYFPNPSGTTFSMKLTDLSGKLVRTAEVTTDQFILERKGLGKGMYVIELKGEKTYRGKLVIE